MFIAAAGGGVLVPGLAAFLGGGVFAALAAIYTIRRQTSGKVSTSDADVLWREATGMRTLLKEDVERQRLRIDVLEKRVNELEHLDVENARLTAENTRLKAEIERLRGERRARPVRSLRDDPSA